jgi:signal transduction histidine kinase
MNNDPSSNIDAERFDFIEVIFDLLREFNTKIINDNDITIRFQCNRKELDIGTQKEQSNDNEAIYIYADKNRIIRVLYNLLSNSIKFTKHGRIDIMLEKNSDHLTLKIRDYGAGMDENILPSLFGKFITTSPSGTGLGLYISKNIIEAHGGKIWAENNKDNQGATFTFTLPINYHTRT